VEGTGESIMEYIAELRRLATRCNFRDFLEQAIRDKFMCGLKAEATQCRLLLEDALITIHVVEIAQGMEAVSSSMNTGMNRLAQTRTKPGVHLPL